MPSTLVPSRSRPTSAPGRRRRSRAAGAAVGALGLLLAVAATVLLASGGLLSPVRAPAGDGAEDAVGATELDPELVRRFEAARAAAADDGVELTITSGLRSAAEQQRLFDEAVAEHGSPDEAARWVLPPERSAHVSGTALDVGGWDGMTWLGEHGAEFGLCQVYANEPWHVEPLVEPGGTCPPLRPDAASDGASG